MTKTRTTIAAAMLVASLTALAVPAQACERRADSGDSRIDRMSESARRAVVGTYDIVGTRACGKKCGSAGREVGGRIFDCSREGASKGGERLQDLGARIRERIEERRRKGR